MELNVDADRLTNDLIAMVNIPSVNRFGENDPANPAEEPMADYFGEQLKQLGLVVDTQEVADGRHNVWGTLKGSANGPTILLAGHLDTVGIDAYDKPFEAYVHQGRVYGRGSCDMKAGLAVYLEVVRMIIESGQPLRGDLIVAGVVDEEHAMIGSAEFGNSRPAVDFAIVAEPSSLAISPAHKGQVCLSIKTTGRSVHSSVAHLGVNAIYHMTSVMLALQKYADDLSLRPPDPMCGNPSFSIGVITGGQNASSVPDHCEITVDRRTVPGESYESVMGELTDILDGVAASIPEFNYEFSAPSLNVPPLNTSRRSPLFEALYESVEAVQGKPPSVVPFPGSTDAPNFNVPAVICGAGALAQCHSLDEYVPVDEMISAVQIYLQTIYKLQSV